MFEGLIKIATQEKEVSPFTGIGLLPAGAAIGGGAGYGLGWLESKIFRNIADGLIKKNPLNAAKINRVVALKKLPMHAKKTGLIGAGVGLGLGGLAMYLKRQGLKSYLKERDNV